MGYYPFGTIADAVDGYIAAKQNVLAPSTIRGYRILRRNRLQSIMKLDVRAVNSVSAHVLRGAQAGR